jgi:hypothetical protein
LDGSTSTLTYTFPESYDYSASTNAPMLGTLSNGAYTFQHLAGVLRIKYASLPAGTKSVKFEANVAITGEFTTTIANHELAQNSTATGKSVTINLSEATAEAGEKDFYIPLPTGSYEGFKVSAIDANSNVLSSYTTYKTYTLKLGDIALFDLKTTGTNYVELLGTSGTFVEKTYKATFSDGWEINNSKSKNYSQTNTTWIKTYNVQHTIVIPTGKAVTKVTFVGYSNSTGSNSNLTEFGGTTMSYAFPKGNTTSNTATHTFVLSEPATSSLTFTLDKTTILQIYITYKDAE